MLPLLLTLPLPQVILIVVGIVRLVLGEQQGEEKCSHMPSTPPRRPGECQQRRQSSTSRTSSRSVTSRCTSGRPKQLSHCAPGSARISAANSHRVPRRRSFLVLLDLR